MFFGGPILKLCRSAGPVSLRTATTGSVSANPTFTNGDADSVANDSAGHSTNVNTAQRSRNFMITRGQRCSTNGKWPMPELFDHCSK